MQKAMLSCLTQWRSYANVETGGQRPRVRMNHFLPFRIALVSGDLQHLQAFWPSSSCKFTTCFQQRKNWQVLAHFFHLEKTGAKFS